MRLEHFADDGGSFSVPEWVGPVGLEPDPMPAKTNPNSASRISRSAMT